MRNAASIRPRLGRRTISIDNPPFATTSMMSEGKARALLAYRFPQVISCSSRHHRSGHHLRVESLLLEGLVRAGSRPPVGSLFYRSLGGILHNRFTERSTLLALKVSQLFAPIHVRLCGYDAVRRVGAPHIKITVLEAALAIVEHIKRLRALSSFTAATALSSIALASSAVP